MFGIIGALIFAIFLLLIAKLTKIMNTETDMILYCFSGAPIKVIVI